MHALLGIALLYLVASLLYIHRLHARLRGYEHVWEQIESIADHNKDGTFTINVQHLEEHNVNEVHETSDIPSGVLPIVLDGTGGLGPRHGSFGRAA